MKTDEALKQQLRDLLNGGNAHLSFDRAVAGLAPALRGRAPEGLPYSPWQLLEHMRLAQYDILEFSRNPDYESPDWPEGYWPANEGPPNARAWMRSVEAFAEDLQAMVDLVCSSRADLFTPFPWGDGQNLLREALLVADHNSYHLGQLIVVRRLLGAWED